MSKEMVISANPHETRVAIMEEGQLCEYYVEREKEFALVGSIYKGRVTRVLPGMQSAFVYIGLDSDAFLYVSDFLENLEEYDHVVHVVEDKVQKMEQQGGEVFAPSASGETAQAETPSAAQSPAGEAVAAAPPAEGEAPAPPASEAPPSVPHTPQAHRPFEQRQDHGRGGYGDRGQRGGRPPRRRGRQSGRDHRQGRDLPTSKYASSRPSDSHRESRYEPPPTDYEPIILPGESLAKYKDRIPAAPAAPATEPPSGTAEAQTELHAPPAEPATGQLAGRLPDSLYATLPPEQPSERVEEEHLNPPSAAASPAQEIRSVPSAPLKAHEPEPESAARHGEYGDVAGEGETHTHNGG